MEIIIGSPPPITPQRDKMPTRQPGSLIEATLLHHRPPRKGIAGPSGMERREKPVKDPLRGRVLTLLVADGSVLPKDLEKYKVQLRFVRK